MKSALSNVVSSGIESDARFEIHDWKDMSSTI